VHHRDPPRGSYLDAADQAPGEGCTQVSTIFARVPHWDSLSESNDDLELEQLEHKYGLLPR